MKKTISIFILLVSLILTSCGKERINQLNNLNASTSDAIQPLELAKNEESWGKWTSRQWKDNKEKWLGSVIGFALVVTGCYFVYNKCFNSSSKPAKVETPKVETPKVETPKVETPKVETPKVETPKVETPKVETPKVETPKVETPKVETPKVETDPNT